MNYIKWKDAKGGALNVWKESTASDIGEGLKRLEWQGENYDVQQIGTDLTEEIMNGFQMGLDFLIDSDHTVVNSEDHYIITIEGLKTTTANNDGYELAENLHFSIKTTEGNSKGISKLIINGDTYELKKIENGTPVELSEGDLEEDKVYQVYYDDTSFIVNFSTLKATEITSGISSFEEIRENIGMPNRGVLTLTKIITYKELWELPHGNYAINSEATLKFLGINGLYAAGILKVYKPNMATSEFLKMFVYISQTVEVPGALTGKATLTVFKNAAEQYADVPVTDNIAVWNEKWKKELSITSEEIKVGNTGFMKLANGIILQWGGDMKSSINGNDFRYFPIAFPQGCASATASYSSLESAGQGVSFQAVDRTKFLLGHRMGDGTLTQGMVYWTAIGY